ncbi:MAG: hypothetical protein KBS91_00615 [Firmicutes bacterium]|nr:hypothetical protein [Candidatus Caballimonas caccae]
MIDEKLEKLKQKERERYEKNLVESVKKDFNERRKQRLKLESQWILNMKFLRGDQFTHISRRGEVIADDKTYFWQDQNVFNHVSPLVESRLSRLSKVAPVIGVRPKTDDDREVKSAFISEKLIENAFKQNDIASIVKDATVWSETCGTSFYKVVWNKYGGKTVGENANEKIYEGEVSIIAVSPFEIFPDNLCVEKIENLESIIHAKALPVATIKNKYGIDVIGRDIDVMDMGNTALNKKEDSVYKNSEIVIEKYQMPTVDFPNGRLITVCGDKLIFDGELPFINAKDGRRTFPFIKQQAIRVAGSFFGTSIIERLIPVQRSFNAVKNRKHEFLNRLSMGVYAVEDGSVDIDDLETEGLEPGKILVYRQGSKAPELLKETSMTDDFSEEETKLMNEFVTISGVSDVSSSSKNASFSSASALSLLVSQDNEKLVMTAEDIRRCYLEMAFMSLKLYEQFTVGIRALKSIDNFDKTKIYYADKDAGKSDDVYLVNENELLYTETQKKEMLFKMYESGILFDEDGELRQSTKEKMLSLLGYKDLDFSNGLSRLHEEKAQRENQELLKNEKAVEYMDDNKIHIDEHTRFILNEYENLNEKTKERFYRHIEEHKNKINEKIEKTKTED